MRSTSDERLVPGDHHRKAAGAERQAASHAIDLSGVFLLVGHLNDSHASRVQTGGRHRHVGRPSLDGDGEPGQFRSGVEELAPPVPTSSMFVVLPMVASTWTRNPTKAPGWRACRRGTRSPILRSKHRRPRQSADLPPDLSQPQTAQAGRQRHSLHPQIPQFCRFIATVTVSRRRYSGSPTSRPSHRRDARTQRNIPLQRDRTTCQSDCSETPRKERRTERHLWSAAKAGSVPLELLGGMATPTPVSLLLT